MDYDFLSHAFFQLWQRKLVFFTLSAPYISPLPFQLGRGRVTRALPLGQGGEKACLPLLSVSSLVSRRTCLQALGSMGSSKGRAGRPHGNTM